MNKYSLPLNSFIKLMGVMDTFYAVFALLIIRATPAQLEYTGVVSIVLAISFTLNIMFMLINFWPFVFKISVKPTASKIKKNRVLKDVKKTLTEVCDPSNNPFIKRGSVGQDVTIAGNPVKQYNFADIQFDLTKTPHFLIAGATGGGKSVSSYNIIKLLNDQYNYPKFAIVDLGNFDYANPVGTTVTDFLYILELFYIIFLGRQKEGKNVRQRRLILLVEEFEAALAGIKSLSKTERSKAERRLGDIARMGRKANIHLLLVVQSGRAAEFPSNIRNNFGNVFIHRSPRNLSQMFACTHDITNLPIGLAWFDKGNGLVKFPLIAEPKMNLTTLQDLEVLVKSYKARFNIVDDESSGDWSN